MPQDLKINLAAKYLQETEAGAYRSTLRILSSGKIQLWSQVHAKEPERFIMGFRDAAECNDFLMTRGQNEVEDRGGEYEKRNSKRKVV